MKILTIAKVEGGNDWNDKLTSNNFFWQRKTYINYTMIFFKLTDYYKVSDIYLNHNNCSSGSFPKLRPVVSSRGTFNYNLARFLYYLLSPLVPNDYSCKNTFPFFLKLIMQIFPGNFLFPPI